MTLNRIASIAVLITVCNTGFADETSHQQAAAELLEVTHSDEIAASLIDEMKQLIDEIPQSDELNAEQSKLLTDFKLEMQTLITNTFGWSAMQEDYSKVYADAYTEEELKQLTAFYKTDLGQKLLEHGNDVAEALDQIPQQRIETLMPQMQQSAQAIMLKIEALGTKDSEATENKE